MNGHERAGMVAIIADDEDTGRLLLAESATSVGLTPIAFDNGAAALCAALEHRVGLVLLDVDMPGMDGFAVCRRLRANARFETVPIVMVTGHDDADAISLAFEAGATDFISKPVNWVLFPRRLEYVLRNAAHVRTLAEREFQIRTLIEALPDRLWVVNSEGELRWSPDMDQSDADQPHDDTLVRARREDRRGGLHIAPPRESARTLEAIRETARDGSHRKLSFRLPIAGQADRSYELRFSRRDGGDVVVVRQDTTERTQAAERIVRLAYFDPLTGLPNRQHCLETAERFMTRAEQSGHGMACITMDLNGFKRINDTFGHAAGDSVLRTVADKLGRALAACDLDDEHLALSRVGGDEFVILLVDAQASSLAARIAEACQRALAIPVTHEGLEFHATPSIGVAEYPGDGGDVVTLMKHADTAMHHAKMAGADSIALYQAAMSGRLKDWLDLEARLRRAVQEDRLVLHFQPKFRLSDNHLAGVEALARWCDPEYGEISPARFIPIAEETGLIIDIGRCVVRAACRQIRSWMDRGVTMPVAINVSGKELIHGDPAGVVEAEARAAGIDASLLEIEITESLLVRDSAAVRKTLDRFRAIGCKIALDDFGTGFSSLAYITRFPPDRIKIDKSFVRDVDRTASGAVVAGAILSLGKSLNVAVTAEGIERAGQLTWLKQRGCDEGQGFLLSHPLSAADLETRFIFPDESAASDSAKRQA